MINRKAFGISVFVMLPDATFICKASFVITLLFVH